MGARETGALDSLRENPRDRSQGEEFAFSVVLVFSPRFRISLFGGESF